MLTYFPLIVGKCDFIAPDCLPLCLAAVCNEVEGRNDISKHCQRHNRPECWVQLGQSNFFRSYQLQNLNRTSDFDEHRLSRWYALRKYNQGHHEFPPESIIKKKQTKLHSYPQLFNHFFLLMSRKRMIWTNENFKWDGWWFHGCNQFPFPASKFRFSWPFGLVFRTSRNSIVSGGNSWCPCDDNCKTKVKKVIISLNLPAMQPLMSYLTLIRLSGKNTFAQSRR